MGYLYNHLATLVCGVFAAVLTGLWPLFVDFAPVLNIVFLMAVPITWFLWLSALAQKSTDYVQFQNKPASANPKTAKFRTFRIQKNGQNCTGYFISCDSRAGHVQPF